MSIQFRPQLLLICLLASTSLAIVGCSKPAEKRASSETNTNKASLPATANNKDTAQALSSQVLTQQNNNPALANKQLIVTANARFEVEDVLQSVAQIEKLTLQNNGYIADSHIENDEQGRSNFSIGNQEQKSLIRYVRRATMLVRVPKSQVSDFLQQLQTQIKFLEDSQFSAKDVTLDLQKAQLEAQIQASKQTALEKQHLANNSEKTQAGNVDVIEQSTLAQQEKLYAQLQQQAIQDQINLSTIELSFKQPEKLRVEISPDINAVVDNEKTDSFSARLLDSLKSGWLYFVEFVLGISKLWAFILSILAGIFGWRYWRRNHKQFNLPIKRKVIKPKIKPPTDDPKANE